MTVPSSSSEVIPRRYLNNFLLLCLRRAGESYGYELCETVRSLGMRVDLAGVYRSLRAMDRRGLVSTRWVPSDNGPDRRVYALTQYGYYEASDADSQLVSLRDGLSAAISAFNATSSESLA